LDGINEPWLRAELTRHINYIKWDKHEQPSGSGVPDGLANAILNRQGEWAFSTAKGIITSPTLRRDGSVLATEGWDPVTELLVMGPLPPMPRVATKPTIDDARRAVGRLDDLLGEFPFVDGPSHSVALSGLITPVVRGALDCVPAHAAKAPAAGTGKSLLWDLAAAIAIGDAMPVISTGEDKQEFSKRVESQMLSGMALWSIDNVSVPIKGDAFCQAIERQNPNVRVMGGNQVRDCRNNWTTYITGNNLRVIGAATRRVIQAALDARTAYPEQRKFKGDPFGTVLRDRGRYIWAALTIVRAYLEAGQPGRLPWFGQTFGQWSDLVRSAVVWLGYADPVNSIDKIRASDPNTQARAALLQAIHLVYDKQRRFAAEMIRDAEAGLIIPRGKGQEDGVFCDNLQILKDAIETYIGKWPTAQHLGRKFNCDQDTITDGLVLRADEDTFDLRGIEIFVA
jgi:putative DNA primase/helicase